MKFNFYISIIFLFLISGCQVSPEKMNAEKFSYGDSEAVEYRIKSDIKPQYAYQKFRVMPDTDGYSQRKNQQLRNISGTDFKIIETGIVTKIDKERTESLSDLYLMNDVIINNKSYVRHTGFSTKIVTPDLMVAYINTLSPELHKKSIERKGGLPLTDDDVLDLIGPEALKLKDMSASIEEDDFENRIKISTPFHDGKMIRASLHNESKKIEMIQAYGRYMFQNSSGNIRNAYDTNGKTWSVTTIDSDVECGYAGTDICVFRETLGVNIDYQLLADNQDGLKLKLKGRHEKIVEFPGDMVRSIVNAINDAREQ